jgi:putative phosphoribosyl transferase
VLNRKAVERMTCEVQLQIVPGASHLFVEPDALEQVAALAASWFVRHAHSSARPASGATAEIPDALPGTVG